MSKEIQNISVNVLKVHPRNTEFFDDISGKEYEAFKNSIQEEGFINEIIVAPDMTIISGHQRYKAAKELGIKLVPVRIREDLLDEDKKLKVLLTANFQRSRNSESKQRKVVSEYVRLCGYKNGGDRKSEGQKDLLKLSEIAKQLGISEKSLKRMLSIERNLTDSMKELLDTGVITKTLAADIIASLSESEQEELLKKLDITQKITQKQVQQYINKIKDLESKPPKIIDNTDYDRISALEEKISILETQKRQLETKIKLNQEDADKFKKLKSEIEFLTKQKSDLSRQINSATELAGLTVSLQKVLENDLAPIKFKRCMEQLDSSDAAVKNLTEILEQIDKWSVEMKNILGIKYEDIIDMQ